MEDKNKSKIVDLQMVKGSNSKMAQFKPNEELIQATSRIKSQRDTILDRVQKMEESKDRVSKSVYDKVQRDYSLQLQTITDLLNEKKELLSKEIKDLYVRREKLSVEVNRHKEILEEAEFRNYLGEFSQSQYQEVENFETKEIEKLESDLSTISEYIRAHEDLFDPTDLGSSVKKNSSEQPSPAQPTSDITKTAAAPQPKAAETVATPAPQPSQPVQHQAPAPTPKPVKHDVVDDGIPVTEINEEISDQDFEALFLSDDDKKKQDPASQSAIQNLLDEPVSESSGNIEAATKPNSDESNYFKQEKPLDDSFTVKKQPAEPEIDSDEDTPDHIEESRQSEPKTKTDTVNQASATPSAPAEAPKKDDSISDILESIQLDDNEKAQEPLSLETEAKSQTGQPMLTLVEGEHEQTEFVVKDNTSIGRSPSNDVVLKAPKVSRQHAAINRYNEQHILIDLKSSNGVYVNGAKVDEAVLNPGDEVSIGGYKFIFCK